MKELSVVMLSAEEAVDAYNHMIRMLQELHNGLCEEVQEVDEDERTSVIARRDLIRDLNDAISTKILTIISNRIQDETVH